MKKTLFFTMVFAALAQLAFTAPEKINIKKGEAVLTNGWADMGGLKYANPKRIILIDDKTYSDSVAKRKAFTNAIASGSVNSDRLTNNEAFIILSGTVDLSDGKVSDSDHSYFDEFDAETGKRLHNDFMYDIGSNKTIIGVKDAKVAFGGLRIKAKDGERKNIIIRNINFWDAHGSTEFDTKNPKYSSKKASADQLVIEGTEDKTTKARYLNIPENIWIDHCTFSDGLCVDLDRNYNHDGALDCKCAKNVTISFCEFTNHDKVTLCGSSDKFTDPSEREITFHDNYYHGCVQRMPRTRAGYFHIYNNVYDNIGTDNNHGASMGPGIGAQFIVENNYFGAHKGSIISANDGSKPDSPTFYKIYVSGNIPELNSSNTSGFVNHKVDTMPWKVPYKYNLKSAEETKTKVPSEAGSGASVSIDGQDY